VISVPIKRFKPGLTGWGDDIEAVMVSWFDGDYMLVSDYEQALAAALDAERERGKRAARQAEDEVSNLRKRIRQAEAERDAAIERAERAERKYTEAEDAEVVTSLVVNLRAERDEWKSKFNMLNECHARTATNGAKATLDAEARADAAEAWQRAVAKELGWCEELGEAIPDAEFMANIARIHGESHMRLKGVEAEGERLRSGSRLYETVLELEAEVERLRGERNEWRRTADRYFGENGQLLALARAASVDEARRLTKQKREQLKIAKDRISKALGILLTRMVITTNLPRTKDTDAIVDAVAALKDH
jgi:hypothetical protein